MTPKLFGKDAGLFWKTKNIFICFLKSIVYKLSQVTEELREQLPQSVKTQYSAVLVKARGIILFFVSSVIYTCPLTYLDILHVVFFLLGKGLPFCHEL